jgi:hypothetical protein
VCAVRDGGGQVLVHRSGDPDRHVGFMAVLGADDDSEPEAREVAGVLMAVAQRPAHQFACPARRRPLDLPIDDRLISYQR